VSPDTFEHNHLEMCIPRMAVYGIASYMHSAYLRRNHAVLHEGTTRCNTPIFNASPA